MGFWEDVHRSYFADMITWSFHRKKRGPAKLANEYRAFKVLQLYVFPKMISYKNIP